MEITVRVYTRKAEGSQSRIIRLNEDELEELFCDYIGMIKPNESEVEEIICDYIEREYMKDGEMLVSISLDNIKP